MNLQGIEFIISLITLVIAYAIAVTTAGSFRAWVALQFGDDTGESLGLLSLNPLAHVDFLGGLFLIFFGFGWGRYVPVNPHKIHGRFRGLKIAIAYLSDSFAHLVMAVVVFTALIYSFGFSVLNLAIPMIYTGNLVQSQFAQVYPESSSLAISLGLIGVALVFLSVLLAVLDFIISGFSLLSMTILEKSPSYSRYRHILVIVIPMLMIYFFINPLRLLVVRFLWFLAKLLGGV
jgi:hypothetical protein